MPNIVLLQPVAYGGDKLLMRFELDAPLPSGAHVDTYINGKFAGSFQRQDGCIVIDKPIKGTSAMPLRILQCTFPFDVLPTVQSTTLSAPRSEELTSRRRLRRCSRLVAKEQLFR